MLGSPAPSPSPEKKKALDVQGSQGISATLAKDNCTVEDASCGPGKDPSVVYAEKDQENEENYNTDNGTVKSNHLRHPSQGQRDAKQVLQSIANLDQVAVSTSPSAGSLKPSVRRRFRSCSHTH